MDRSYSKQQVVVLDCCHSGAFAHGAKAAQGATVGTAEAFEGTGLGRVILTATDATQYAWEGDRIIGDAETSLFTHFLVDGLKTGAADLDQDGQVTVDELYDYVRDRVVDATPRQTPRKWSYRQEGDVVIAQNPFAKRVELPFEIERARTSNLWSLRLEAVRQLKELLRGRNTEQTRAALAALSTLAQDDSRDVANAAAEALKAHKREWPDVVEPTSTRGEVKAAAAPPSLVPPKDARPRSDIFISYEHSDRHKARMLANALVAEGWTVWWDRKIAPGEAFDLVIERELASCNCVIVLWTSRSVGATWVRNEARRAAKRRVLVPVLMEAIGPPLEFENLQAADLTSWEGNAEDPEFEAVLERIQALAPRTVRLARVAVENAMREFAAGRTREALTSLEQFRPPTPIVSQALENLRAEAAHLESVRAEAARRRAETHRRQQQLAAASEHVNELSSRAEFDAAKAGDHPLVRDADGGDTSFTLLLRPDPPQQPEEQSSRDDLHAAIVSRPQTPSALRSKAVQAAIVAGLTLLVALGIVMGRRLPAPESANDRSQSAPAPDQRASAEALPRSTREPESSPGATPTEAPLLPATRIEGSSSNRAAARENRPDRIEPTEEAKSNPGARISVNELRARARTESEDGDRGLALTTVVEGLRLYPKDAGLTAILNALRSDAAEEAALSKRDAMNVDAEERSEDAFRAGVQKEREAERLRRSGRIDSSIRALWAAADQFSAAAADAKADNEKAAEPPPRDSPSVEANQKPADSALEEALALKTLRRYEAAYAALDVQAVRSVFPTAPIDELTRDFAGYRSYSMSIKVHEYRLYRSADLTWMNVPATIVHVISPKSGMTTSTERSQTIQLVKQGGAWVIRQIR
jgi:hypothetical protein